MSDELRMISLSESISWSFPDDEDFRMQVLSHHHRETPNKAQVYEYEIPKTTDINGETQRNKEEICTGPPYLSKRFFKNNVFSDEYLH
jgi:hypothetical protein